MAMAGAAILFGIFVTNILLGAFGASQFLGDVPEALTLFAASILFVAGIIRAEAKEKKSKSE